MGIIGLSIANNFSIDGSTTPPREFVFLKDADAGSLCREQASSTAIKRAIGIGIITQSNRATLGEDEEEERVEQCLTAARYDHICGIPSNSPIGHTQRI